MCPMHFTCLSWTLFQKNISALHVNMDFLSLILLHFYTLNNEYYEPVNNHLFINCILVPFCLARFFSPPPALPLFISIATLGQKHVSASSDRLSIIYPPPPPLLCERVLEWGCVSCCQAPDAGISTSVCFAPIRKSWTEVPWEGVLAKNECMDLMTSMDVVLKI